MKLSDLLEARFAKQTYPDDEMIRLLKEPIKGHYHGDAHLLGTLENYFMDEEKDLRWRLKALRKYDQVTGNEKETYDVAELEDAMKQLRDNAVPYENP